MNIIQGLWPGVVNSYAGGSRTCRVEIEGITEGSGVRPEAVFCNPLGDNAESTEIRIRPGDPVWLSFEGGDPRYPIIMGYRTPRTGNPTGWRRWQHANVELIAEDTLLITVGATTVTVTDGLMTVAGADLIVEKNIICQQNIAALQNITAGQNISDQGGTKSMATMRSKFNTHGGHFDNSNRVPDNQM